MTNYAHIPFDELAKGEPVLLASHGVDETRAVAAELARRLLPGTVITLAGDLGAGKTHFTQGLAQGLGVKAQVTSPTFNILVSYEGGRLPLFHFDLYRLEQVAQLEDIGFYDVLDQGGVCCIEWAERFPGAMPEDVLAVTITVDDDGTRQVRLQASAALAGQPWLSAQEQGEGSVADEPAAAMAAKAVFQDAAPFAEPAARDYVLAFDTANETIAVGLGLLDREARSIRTVAQEQTLAFRASNTKLVACIDALLAKAGVAKGQLACVVCGRGPGSFTGVRICMATAKGLAMGLGVSLFGVSTLDAQAWEVWEQGYRGQLVVLGDAMRKEVYPVTYLVGADGPERLNPDTVIKAAAEVEVLGKAGAERLICGDALNKYAELFAECGSFTEEGTWMPTGNGLLLCAAADWRAGAFDPDDAALGNPLALLPVYTRLSDAEESERQRFADAGKRDLATGVQGGGKAKHSLNAQANDAASLESAAQAKVGEGTLTPDSRFFLRYQPLEAAWCEEVARLERQVMGSDAWNAAQVADELPRPDRSWWACYATTEPDRRMASTGSVRLVGYAGGWIVDGQLQILKIASDPTFRRMGIARELLGKLASDARDLGATEATLEVRASNVGAHAFYEQLGLRNVGRRPRYYSDREDAFIFTGPLPVPANDVAGMSLRVNEGVAAQTALRGVRDAAQLPKTLILAIESSCDETAVAIVDGEGTIISDVVASQIDFHSRFGGVVPEIASRKHIEAIGGVVQECLAQAREVLGVPTLGYADLSAIGVTYAPGLLGALVVGVAFAKGLSWSTGVPLVGVNHLEGHLYANKIAQPDIKPPMVVSLVSGGHTMLVHVKDWGQYETMGSTLDDAVGEAFDKVAKAMGLGYPGGPLISALAKEGNPKAVRFPRAMMHSGDLAFSLSGLKTAVMTYMNNEERAGRAVNQADVAASFQAAVIDVQVAKAKTALQETGAKEFCLGGGVAANPELRAAYERMCAKLGVRLTMPPLKACTDNASMIALVALERFEQGRFFGLDCDAKAHASLDEPY